MTNTIGATPKERELIERLQTDAEWSAQRLAATPRQIGRDCAQAATLLESLISDRAKLREALEMAVKMLDDGGFAYPAEWLALVNTTKGQSNAA